MLPAASVYSHNTRDEDEGERHSADTDSSTHHGPLKRPSVDA